MLPRIRKTLKKPTHLDETQLPSFHHSNNFISDYFNTQKSANPSDVVFILQERDYKFMGTQLKEMGLLYKLRLSNKPIESFAFLDDQEPVFWSLFGFESLLSEPLTLAASVLKVSPETK